MAWKDIIQDDVFNSLSPEYQKQTAVNYFNKNIAENDEYLGLTDDDRKTVRDNFFLTIKQEVPYEVEHPTMAKLGSTLKDIGLKLFPDPASQEEYLGSIPYSVRKKVHEAAGDVASKVSGLFTGESDLKKVGKSIMFNAYDVATEPWMKFSDLLPPTEEDDQEIAYRTAKAILRNLEFTTTPLMGAIGKVSQASSTISRMLSTLFAVDMSFSTGDAAARALKAYEEGKKGDFMEAVVDGAFGSTFAYLAMLHATNPEAINKYTNPEWRKWKVDDPELKSILEKFGDVFDQAKAEESVGRNGTLLLDAAPAPDVKELPKFATQSGPGYRTMGYTTTQLPHEGAFGLGGYYTNDRGFVRERAGEATIYTRDINLSNPRVTTPEELFTIYNETASTLRGKVPDSEVVQHTQKIMRKYFTDSGYDGIIIKDGYRDLIVDFTDTGTRQIPQSTLQNKDAIPNFMQKDFGKPNYNPSTGTYEIKLTTTTQSDKLRKTLNENDYDLTRFEARSDDKNLTESYLSIAENGDQVMVHVASDIKTGRIKGITAEPLNEVNIKSAAEGLRRSVDAYVFSYESVGGRVEIAKQVSQLERLVSDAEQIISDPSVPEMQRSRLYESIKDAKQLIESPQFKNDIDRIFNINPMGVDETTAGFFDNLIFGLKETAAAVGEFLKPEPGALGSFGVFSESAYTKAKPRLVNAYNAYRRAGRQFVDFYRDMVGRWGAGVIPYLERFGQDNNIVLHPVTPGATVAEELYAENLRKANELKRQKYSKEYLRNESVRAIVDTSGNLRRALNTLNVEEALKALQKKVLARGASGEALRNIEEAESKVFKNLTRVEKELLNKYVAFTRVLTIENYKPGRSYFQGVTPEVATDWLSNFHAAYPPDVVTRVKASATNYFKAMHDYGIKILADEGVISLEQYNKLKDIGPYSPMEYLQHMQLFDKQTIGGKTLSTKDPAVSFLTEEGSLGILETNAELLMQHMVNRVQSDVFKHRANKALYDLAVAEPDNGVVKIAPIVKRTAQGRPVYKAPENGWSNIHMIDQGKEIVLQMPDAMAREWVTSDPAINRKVAEVIGWGLGVRILKATATGYNPGFIVRNAAMDLPHIFLTTHEYSSVMPVAMLQQAADLAIVAKDAFTRKGRWIDAQKEGISMDFLAEQGAIKTGKSKVIDKTLEVLGYLNKTSEIWSRLALYRRALKNTGDKTYAAFVARDYLDFSQGGYLTKTLDVGLPYLNAGIQGTRGVLRAAKTDPALFIWKAAQIGTLAFGLTYYAYGLCKEAMDDVPEETKNGYFVIPLGNTYRIDSSGNKRYKYIKIRKDQGQRAIAAFFEEAAKMARGDDYDFMRAAKGIKDIMAFLPEDLNIPLIQAFRSYKANYDFWRDEPIWKGAQVKPEREFTQYTHPAFKELGKVAHISPERARVFISQFIAPNNTWTQLIGGSIKVLNDQLTPQQRDEAMKQLIRNVSIIGGAVSETSKYTASKKRIVEITTEENTRRLTQEQDLRGLFDSYYQTKGSDRFSTMFSYITKQPPKDHMRLSNAVERWLVIRDINPVDTSWWMSIANKLPEVRAQALFDRWNRTDKPGKLELMNTAYRIPGFWTDKVAQEFEMLKR